MSNCICGTFRCLSATFNGIIRCILFLGCVILTLSSALGLWALYMIETNVIELNFPGLEVTFRSYLFEAILLIVSIMGAHGAYSKNPKYLKLFALFIAIYAVVHFFMVAEDLSGTDWAKNQQQFSKIMTDYAKDYQWDVPFDKEPNKGTRAWNLIQSRLRCCGLEDPSDWTKGPLHQGGNSLPQSCCVNLPRFDPKYAKCTRNSIDLFEIGCTERIQILIHSAFAQVIIKSFLFLLFSIFALIIARQGNQIPAAVVYSSPAGGPVYERFGGSIYVRSSQPVAGGRGFPSATGNNNLPKQPPVAPANNLYPKIELPPPRYTSS